MTKTLLIFFTLLLTLDARENPFFPSVGEKETPFTSNENRDKEPLKRATITLPAQARILQKVTIEFKNLDGSLESKSIELDNAVDWHLPIFISQSYGETQVADKPLAEKQISKKIIADESMYKNIASIKNFKLYSSDKSLKIVTDDEMIRNFLLVNPHRIVVDFKREIDIRSYVKKYPKDIFKAVRIGSHKGYYRAVIELDGPYRYSLKKISNGYIMELK
ncbi:MAG: AMIN domain-containing protein [Sulfurimonas sp.]|uniref:AMIN domain-containing protein n=1 Tax=Sulfurimonas sp. TaxID=2022749 RepID=UPI002607EC25|nr:AMIN domain-containing protein [Sulfurimonas sp.]MCW8895410.1 AMIN domain-containing protein [Sulfurimonas sp.]MCW8953403.1 AMIN domain-containing protein [Sulfurimonas sp.]MCW9067965.1 AMIN domain-containing protein [Sulfurimonas sp.]